ncbi:OmpA family protein [Hymenobacter arizonensis]|uniref:Outer membrane protein OmpA n=1 Tax=Hymenobacter arizonensis TaxID=1227077 RepID=A0A1I5ZT70_HYMAR|nr:PA14 domain-containing protein [Hymenobacter arizonensis]SFQ59553.1 Outer membrane protein OmpA [Hymenobacter arizonensis]
MDTYRNNLLGDARKKWIGLALALVLVATPGRAQTQALPTGDGLKGAYYRGPNFDSFVLTRRDATIDFDWNFRPPGPGLPNEYFSVRWTGWLVAPATGRFLFHARVDDGIRVWIDDELILDEWRPQRVRDFTATIALNQGTAYRLKVEYFQDILHTRAFLNWSPPDESNTDRRANANASIPTRYLFSTNPGPALVAVVTTPPAAPAAVPPPAPVADTSRNAQVARLAKGEGLNLPEMYFQQGKAILLPPARAALNRLAPALLATPDRRFEVQGHTDNVGTPELNLQLSQRRAEAVCRYLIARGVPAEQLAPTGYGSTQPVADNADPAQRPLNRRVVLRRL